RGGYERGTVMAEPDDRDQGHRRLAVPPPGRRVLPLLVPGRLLPGRLRPGRLLPGQRPGEALPGQLVQAEGGVQLPDDVVRRRIAVLQLVHPRRHLVGHEPTDGVPDGQLLLGPLEHGVPPSSRAFGQAFVVATGGSTRTSVLWSVCRSTAVRRPCWIVVVSSEVNVPSPTVRV